MSSSGDWSQRDQCQAEDATPRSVLIRREEGLHTNTKEASRTDLRTAWTWAAKGRGAVDDV